MLNKKITEKLDSMVNKTFQYGGAIHCITGYQVSEESESVTIKTNLKPFTKKFDALTDFLGYWEEVTTAVTHVQLPGSEVSVEVLDQIGLTRADRMIALLEANIEKVQVDPTYIPQATSINNNVNSIINIEKMRMQMMRVKKGK